MARDVSSGLSDLLALRSINTQTTLDIIPTSGPPIYLATDAFTANSHDYIPELRQCDQIQQSIAVSTNRVVARIQNIDKVFGGSIFDEEWTKAEAIVGRLFRDEQDFTVDEWAELFRGQVIPIEITENEAVIEIVHDLTAAGYVIANSTLAENCQWVFKQSDTCGYSGGETACNHMRRSLLGCQGRANEYRFGGMEFPDPQTPEPPSGPVDTPAGGGGDIPGFPTCPRSDQYILVRGDSEFNRVARRAKHVKAGDHIWDPINQGWNTVVSAQLVAGQQIWEVTAANGAKTYVTETHPVIRDIADADGCGVKWLKPGAGVLTWSNGRAVQSVAKIVRRTQQRADVVMIETTGNHIFCSGERPEAMIAGHNNVKPVGGPEN